MTDEKPNTYDYEGSRAKSELLKDDPIIIEMATEIASLPADAPDVGRNTFMLSVLTIYEHRGGKIEIAKHIAAPMDAIDAINGHKRRQLPENQTLTAYLNDVLGPEDEDPKSDFIWVALRLCDCIVSNINSASGKSASVRLSAATHQAHQVKEIVANLISILRALAFAYDKEAKMVGSHYSRSTVLTEVAADIRAAMRGQENASGPMFHQELSRLTPPATDIITRIDKYLEGATSEYLDHSNGCDLLAEARAALIGQSPKTR